MEPSEKTPNYQHRTSNAESSKHRPGSYSMFGVQCSMFDVYDFSWKQHPDLFERAEIRRKFHARLGVKAEFNRARIHHLADGDAFGKNAAEAAGDDILAGLQTRAAGKIGQIHEQSVQRAARADYAHVARRIFNERSEEHTSELQ